MNCKACNKEIVFLTTKNRKFVPVNAETIQGKETIYNPKIGHRSHFATCKYAYKFRK